MQQLCLRLTRFRLIYIAPSHQRTSFTICIKDIRISIVLEYVSLVVHASTSSSVFCKTKTVNFFPTWNRNSGGGGCNIWHKRNDPTRVWVQNSLLWKPDTLTTELLDRAVCLKVELKGTKCFVIAVFSSTPCRLTINPTCRWKRFFKSFFFLLSKRVFLVTVLTIFTLYLLNRSIYRPSILN